MLVKPSILSRYRKHREIGLHTYWTAMSYQIKLTPNDDLDKKIYDIDALPRKKLFDENGNSDLVWFFGDELPRQTVRSLYRSPFRRN